MPTQKIIPKYKCKYCGQIKFCKNAFDRHFIFCQYANTPAKERELQETTLPSQQVMLQMMLDLSLKCQKLEEKMARIQAQQSSQSRKSILQYLNSLPHENTTFSKWIENLAVKKEHLRIFFDENIMKSLTHIVLTSEQIPIRNYVQKPKNMYIYDHVPTCVNVFEWRLITSQDWKRGLQVLIKKIKNMYFDWKKENQSIIDTSDVMTDLNYEYMKKVNNIDSQIDATIRQIKEALIQKIQTNLVVVE